jgi:hypothetical protein
MTIVVMDLTGLARSLRRFALRRTFRHIQTPEFEEFVQRFARELGEDVSEAISKGGMGTSSVLVPKPTENDRKLE